MSTQPLPIRHHPSWTPAFPDLIATSVNSIDLRKHPSWSQLDDLSNDTIFEGIQVFPENASTQNGLITVPANVYVKLRYLQDNIWQETHDAYPMIVTLKEENGLLGHHAIEIDTSSFFE